MIPRILVLACALQPTAPSAPPVDVQEAAAPREPAPEEQQPGADELPPAPELLDPAALEARADGLARELEVVERLPLYPGLRSRGGRALYALRLAAPDAPRTRPAILLVAGVDGPGVFSSALALAHCEALARGWRDGDQAARDFLGAATLYVVPSANPDGAAARFETPRTERFATGTAVDTDRDGRIGEDGPADLDGDGRVLWMRVPDPEGTWTGDPDDPRVLVEAVASRGQQGRWKLWPEGRDDDDDELIAEDRAHDARVDRNFAYGWKEHDQEAGRYPMDEPAARALAEFTLLHEDVALVLTYGRLDNLVDSPKGVTARPGERIPPDGVLEGDAPYLAELGRRYRELVEHEARSMSADETAGSFQAWAYHHRGLPSLAVVPWDIPLDAKAPESPAQAEGSGDGNEAPPAAGGPASPRGREKGDDKPSDDVKRLVWIDAQGPEEAWRFVDWRPFEHPELGPVELGGLAPYARYEPPAEVARRIAADQYAFLLSLADALPRARLEDGSARLLGDGLVEVEVSVAGRALLPVRGEKAIDTRVVRAPRVALVLPEGARLLSGHPVEQVRDAELAGGGRAKLRWLVAGLGAGAPVGLELTSDQAGSDRATLEVTR